MAEPRHPVIEEDMGRVLASPVPWEALRDARVLVSGAYGFVVAYVVEAILYANERLGLNAKVTGLVRNPEKAWRRFPAYRGRPDLKFLFQDVCAPIPEHIAADFVIHGASWASPKYYGSQPVGSLMPNVMGTFQLLELARRCRSRGFLFFSSAEMYGKVPPDLIPTPETFAGLVQPTEVRSCYAESKRMGETMCVAWHKEHGVPSTMARIFHTYGPGMALDDGRVFADFTRDILEGRNIRMMSDGAHRRTFCYLSDASAALLMILLKGAPATAYNMGNDDAEVSIAELAEIMVGLFPERGLRVERVGDTHPTGYLRTAVDRACPDTRRLRGLGWTPHIGVAEGFRRTVLSYE
ncbi:MAG TPA: NAD-dependent epimerase/dehydratase family protein [Kiritimatiellia bacterium]|nr:NAD-dependent epimerase/dehydratase family protein [Kiritimatiellia bacterium]